MPRTVGPYNIGHIIGQGTFGAGDVHEVTHVPSGKKMAMKVIDRSRIVDPTLGEQLKREIAIMKLLKHPNVVSVSPASLNFKLRHACTCSHVRTTTGTL